MTRASLLAALALCLGCANFSLGVTVALDDRLPDDLRLELAVFEPAIEQVDFCERFAFGDLDLGSFAGALAEFVPDLREANGFEVARGGAKLLVVRGIDAAGVEVARGCAETGEIGRQGNSVRIEVLPVTRIVVLQDLELTGAGERGGRELLVRIEDVAGELVDGTDLRLRRCGPAVDACVDESIIFTPDTEGNQVLRLERGAPGAYRVFFASRFIEGEPLSGTGVSLPDPVDIAGFSLELRRAVRIGDGFGFLAWRPPSPGAVGRVELGLFAEGALGPVAGVDASVLMALNAVQSTTGDGFVVPVLGADGSLTVIDATLTAQLPVIDTGLVWSPGDPIPEVTGPFFAGDCADERPPPFYVDVRVAGASTSFAYPDAARAFNERVVGGFCVNEGSESRARYIEVEDANRSHVRFDDGEVVPPPSFRTANVDRRRADGGVDLIFAHLVPPLNELRVEEMAFIDDGLGRRVASTGRAVTTPGVVLQVLSGSFTAPDVIARDGAEELVFLVGEVELIPEFRLLPKTRLAIVSGAFEGGTSGFIEFAECDNVITCQLESGDIDGDGADEILIARSNIGFGPAATLLIDLSP